MTLSTSESIVAQVAAKIAADLVDKNGQSLGAVLDDWDAAFQTVKKSLYEAHGFGQPDFAQSVALPQNGYTQSSSPPSYSIDQAEAAISNSFQGTTLAQHSIRVKGDQHGPLPDWLFAEAAAAGVDEVWDNRGDLGPNGNRPHFKSTSKDPNAPAFWPPRPAGARR